MIMRVYLTIWYNLEPMWTNQCRKTTFWWLSNFHEYGIFTKYKCKSLAIHENHVVCMFTCLIVAFPNSPRSQMSRRSSSKLRGCSRTWGGSLESWRRRSTVHECGCVRSVWHKWPFEQFGSVNNVCDDYACLLTIWYNLEPMWTNKCRKTTFWLLSNFHEYGIFTKYKCKSLATRENHMVCMFTCLIVAFPNPPYIICLFLRVSKKFGKRLAG